MASQPIRMLVVIVNYGDTQINHLNKMVDEFVNNYTSKFQIDTVVHSNIPIPTLQGKANVVVVVEDMSKYPDPHMFPISLRKTVYDNRDKYDLFLSTENDHL